MVTSGMASVMASGAVGWSSSGVPPHTPLRTPLKPAPYGALPDAVGWKADHPTTPLKPAPYGALSGVHPTPPTGVGV